MDDLQQLRIDLLSDFYLFNRFIFKERTGRDFIISKPMSNESHFITICKALEDVFHGHITRLLINCPPGWSKSELIKNFICWGKAWYPDSNELYISYAHELASSHTHTIRQTMQLPIYRKLFGVEINRDSSAKDFFKTSQGGAVAAFGSSGPVTGRDAGLPAMDRYSGGVFVDDLHKPDEVHSDVIREKIIKNFDETIVPRCRGFKVPIVVFGQRLHQRDIFAYLMSGDDGQHWDKVIIKGMDDAGNARYPEVMPLEKLKSMKKYKPYVYSSQFQQEPIPAGGGLFLEENFVLLEKAPDMLITFITVDTSETEDEWNDKTVFSFWGVYPIKVKDKDVDELYGLHWLDCKEFQCEPKDLESEFLDFWSSCMTYKVQPKCAIIEKKSTGVTLISVLKNTQGLKVIGIDRTSKSKSKIQRFIDMQYHVAAKLISLPLMGRHTKMCTDHMKDITANGTHRFDDIADTAYHAVNAVYIDKTIVAQIGAKVDYDQLAKNMMQGQQRIDQLRKKAYGSG